MSHEESLREVSRRAAEFEDDDLVIPYDEAWSTVLAALPDGFAVIGGTIGRIDQTNRWIIGHTADGSPVIAISPTPATDPISGDPLYRFIPTSEEPKP